MKRKPLVTLESIKQDRQIKAVNNIVVRRGSGFLKKLQTQTAKKLP